jgi:HTH-type transcriptional regulator, sugar sensing transcriptional regulator
MAAQIVDVLREIGFTEYEAKIYVSLLEESPLSGYAVALKSGVPRSKIYEVLGALARRGDVVVSQEETPRYMPLDPELLVARRREKSERDYRIAREALEEHRANARLHEGIWSIVGSGAIFEKARDCAARAKRRILLEIWKDDVGSLADCLAEAARRGVDVKVVSYGEVELDFATVYRHDLGERITSDYGGRWLVFSMDDREIVAGIVSQGERSRAAWTSHPGLVMPITEVIIHDLYIMEIMSRFRGELEAAFGPDLIELRRSFSMNADGRKDYIASLLDPS